ncbi:MAG: winged helix DNA-binding domain-containing protein [Chloroflexota bacterium]|nr:winged helix DNA-binding domain-containing protein [Chloroflexota bacterium]
MIERLRPRLRSFRDQHGRELFDLPDAPRPDAETPAPPRFLPEYDNVLLAYRDRSRFQGDHDVTSLVNSTEVRVGSVLINGRLAGRWKLIADGDTNAISITPLWEWSDSDAGEVYAEAERFKRLLLSAGPQSYGCIRVLPCAPCRP